MTKEKRPGPVQRREANSGAREILLGEKKRNLFPLGHSGRGKKNGGWETRQIFVKRGQQKRGKPVLACFVRRPKEEKVLRSYFRSVNPTIGKGRANKHRNNLCIIGKGFPTV